jgi:acetyl esterase/lipase
MVEFKFPMSQHDSLDSLIWIANNATDPIINSDPKKGFIMGGVSAGAATTAAFSRLFQEEPLSHPLTGQWLCIPSVMDASHVPDRFKDYYLSTEQQAKNPFFSKESRERLAAITGWDIKSPLRYAMNSKTPFSGQPRTYFQVAGADPLRDDALIYDEFLSEAGVKTKVDIYPGCPHGHMMAFPTLEVAKKTNIDTIVGFGWLLGKEIAHEDAAKELGL